MFRSGTIQICYKPICPSECWHTELLQGWKLRDGTAPENTANPGLRRADNVGPGGACPLLLPTRDQTPDSSLVPHLPAPAPPPQRRSEFPARRRPGSGRVEEGWHFLAAASLAQRCSDKALTDRHQMLFQAAPSLARSFRFSTVGNRERGACRRHKPPASGGSRAQEKQGPCVRKGVGADAAPHPHTFYPTLLLKGPWKRRRRPLHARENDPAIIG